MNWFRPPLTIILAPDELRFITKTHDVRVQPLIRLDLRGFILGIGEEANDNQHGGYLVNLFQRPSHSRDLSWFNELAYTRFFRYLVVLMMDSKRIRHPIVKIEGVRRFELLFDGHEVEIFARVLKKAGAARVEFADI